MTFAEALLVMLLISAFIFVIGRICEVLIVPLRVGKKSRLDMLLSVKGSEPGLEETVRSLRYLRNSGKSNISIFIVDDGMDEDTRKTAELLTRNDTEIRLCTIKELCSESCNEDGIHRDKGICGRGNISE